MLYSRDPSTAKTRPNRWPYIVAVIIVIVLAAGSVLYATNRLPFWHRTSPPPITRTTADSNTKGVPANSSSATANSQIPGATKSNSQTANGPLVAPTGDFVSHHTASLSDNPSGSGSITSTCTTTPGATCQITFTQGSKTISLPTEMTDASGTVYWNNWKLNDYGFTTGSWTITAVAQSGGQTKTATDALQLEVGP